MKKALDSINERITTAITRRRPDVISSGQPPRLIAVSKLKPVSCITEAYKCGQRYFGENYIQELEKKSNSDEIIQECPDIRFHFIGHLQSNKVNKLLKVRNLEMVETIDSANLADLVNSAIDKQHRQSGNEADAPLSQPRFVGERLKVLVQVNTSDEEQKNGIEPSGAPGLAAHILHNCNRLQFAGLMTIGRLGGWPTSGPNMDFVRLHELRTSIAKSLSLDPHSLELSMGMSSDFEEAIAWGSTNVRVGTLIFGERPPK